MKFLTATAFLFTARGGNGKHHLRDISKRIRVHPKNFGTSSGDSSNQREPKQQQQQAANSTSIKSLLICGPSGVGKGTLISKLLSKYPNSCGLSVSHTSRSPRPGEIDGIHYYFISKEQFQHEINHGKFKFLETALVHGNYYGTREDSVLKVHQSNKICVLDLDTKGLKQLKNVSFPMKTIFILPPSLQELEHRLRARGTEKEEQILLRLKNAREEIEFGKIPGNFDRLLINGNLHQAFDDLTTIVREWFPTYFPQQ
jgi:guanylate kinase